MLPRIFTVKLVNGVARIGYISRGNSARFSDETLPYQMLNKARIFIDNNKEQPFSYIFHFTIFMNLDYQTHIFKAQPKWVLEVMPLFKWTISLEHL